MSAASAACQRGRGRPRPLARLPCVASAAAELRDHAVDRREVLQRAGGQDPVELTQRPRRRQRALALDLPALELLAQQLFEALERGLREPLARILACFPRATGAQPQRPPDALHIHAWNARSLLPTAGGRDRQARQIPKRPLGATCAGFSQGCRDPCPEGLDLLRPDLAPELADVVRETLPEGRQLDGAEEDPVEDQLEQAPLLRALGQGGAEGLPELALPAPVNLLQRPEGVQQLRRPDRDPLPPQLRAELHQLPRESGLLHRAVSPHRPPGRASARPAPRPRRGLCGV